MRVRRIFPALLLGSLLATACASGDEATGDATGDGATSADTAVQDAPTVDSPAGQAADGTQTAESLTIAVREDVGPLNIFASHEEPLTELVYDKLLSPSPYVDQPRPWLAESVAAIDASTWEVTLRDGVTWHDGEPFDAADVVFTFELFKAAPTGRWTHHVSDIPTIETIQALDDATVRFTCAFACPKLGSVTLADLPIIPEHVWSQVDPEQVREVTELPVGTGPYRLVEYSPERGYRFEANPDYFAGAPLVGELRMPVIAEPSTAFTALRAGELDATTHTVAPELLEQFQSTDGIAVATTSPLQFVELRLNFEVPPLDQPRFRRAVSRAIDREALLGTVILGQGRPATQGYPHPDSPWTNPELSTPTDPADARMLLDELGFVDGDGDGIREREDGTPLEFTLKVTGSQPTHVRAGELLARQLGAVGIGIEVQALDAGTIGGLFRSREFDLYINQITAHGVADPTQFIMSHRSGYLWRAPDLAYPEWDALFEEWRQAASIEDRTEVLFAMQELFNGQPTAVPLYYPDEHWAYRPAAYAGWVESPGYGIVHKWSFLPAGVAAEANAVTQRFAG
jgi:peptide/nickel transport system substrate-binding protein